MKIPKSGLGKKSAAARGYLDGQMLIASPSMSDDRFARSLVYICAHSPEGAMGIVVNQPASNIKFPDLLLQLNVVSDKDKILVLTEHDDLKVMKVGQVEMRRGL